MPGFARLVGVIEWTEDNLLELLAHTLGMSSAWVAFYHLCLLTISPQLQIDCLNILLGKVTAEDQHSDLLNTFILCLISMAKVLVNESEQPLGLIRNALDALCAKPNFDWQDDQSIRACQIVPP